MKLKNIFVKSKGNAFVSLTLAITCVIVILMTLSSESVYNMFSTCYPADFWWQYASGMFVHGTPQLGNLGSILHLGFNLLMIIPFGLLCEKVIGSNKFSLATLSFWILQSVGILAAVAAMTPEGEKARAAGISGLGFMYLTIGTYILFLIMKHNKKAFFKQVLTYVYLNIIIDALIMAGIAGLASLVVHLFGVLCGVAVILIFKTKIRKNTHRLCANQELWQKSSKLNLLWVAVPIFYIVTYIAMM